MDSLARPTARQLEFQDWEFGLFVHFGIRTFHQGHRDWDNRPMAPAAFDPTQLDCGQWIATAKAAGMNYAVLTAKHHDGFANWPTKFGKFSVAATPWKGGKGDVVREFLDACRAHDVHPGLYYSPAEWGNPTFADGEAYDRHFLNQVGELLGNYGPIDILWFDGCGSADHQYGWGRIVDEIRRLQPGILIFHMADPDFRWVGNEAGIAPRPLWNTVHEPPMQAVRPKLPPEGLWLPAECDCMIRDTWFYSDANLPALKSAAELMGMYCYSVGRGGNLLLNLGPDRRGLLDDDDAARLREFGEAIRRRFASPLATFASPTLADGQWTFELPAAALIDHAVLREDLADGERIRRFRIATLDHGLTVVYEGLNVGHKAICSFPPIVARRLAVILDETVGTPRLRDVSVLGAR